MNFKQVKWNSLDILADFKATTKPRTQLDEMVRQTWGKSKFEDLLWHEVCSEYDARHLTAFSFQKNSNMSEEFKQFMDLWLADENNHHIGFKHLYQEFTNLGAAEVNERVQSRVVSPQALPFATDEFSTCVLLAYDEMVTAMAYPLDYPLYDSLDENSLSRWIRMVCRDEIYHCVNVIKVLHQNHSKRFPEIPRLMEQICEHSQTTVSYDGTFVLDHQGFPPELLQKSKMRVLKLLSRSN